MRATGIVRRIDELGRIVIPKKIRDTLGIKDDDPMEIFFDEEDGLVLKPYRPEGLIFSHIKSRWQSLTMEERQKLLNELVSHINDSE